MPKLPLVFQLAGTLTWQAPSWLLIRLPSSADIVAAAFATAAAVIQMVFFMVPSGWRDDTASLPKKKANALIAFPRPIDMAATVWKGYISFGLVSFPVHLLAAARPKAIHFHMLHQKDLSRVKEVLYCAEEDKPITRAEIVKGHEISKAEYVVVTDEELKKIAPSTATAMEILQFVSSGDVDPIYLESSYYVAAEEGGAKPYALLLRAMTETKYYAVAKLTMHGREHVVIIRPTGEGLVLHTMYYVDELQKANAVAPPSEKHGPKEIELAKTLIKSLAGPFKPERFHDQYRENVEKLLEAKQKGQKTIPTVKQPHPRPVVNIMDALKRSLAESKKSSPASVPRKN
jgi:DNA end-binding protein Ku